jgi:hypothetical protein
VTIGDGPFSHLLYHSVLAFLRWEYASVVDGGERLYALAKSLQNTLWQAAGCRREHRSDGLSADSRNLEKEEDFTARYAALLEHYGMEDTRNNRSLGHGNGSVESSHRYLKDQIDQAMNDIESCDRPRTHIFHVTCALHMHGYELLMAP